MIKKKDLILLVLVGLLISLLACSVADNLLNVFVEPTETPTPLPTDTPRPTPTSIPTRTPNPTATPDLAYEELLLLVQNYYDEGYLPSLDGDYRQMDDFREEWAQMEWFQWWTYDTSATNFLLSTHLKWSSASGTPELAGCGVVFAIQDDGQNYAVFLDRDRIYFTRTDKKYYYEIGKTKGTGRVEYDVSDDADFILIVIEKYAYVIVDGKLIGEYTLSQDQPIQGHLGFSILSGTNKDYGTRCEATHIRVWIVDP